MNCAPITIEGGSNDKAAFDKLPEIYVANVGNGKTTVEGVDVVFPNPGDGSSGGGAPSGDAPASPSAASSAAASSSATPSSASPSPSTTIPALHVHAASNVPTPSLSASEIKLSGVASGIGASGDLPFSCSCSTS